MRVGDSIGRLALIVFIDLCDVRNGIGHREMKLKICGRSEEDPETILRQVAGVQDLHQEFNVVLIEEIEESLSQYDIGDLPHMDDVSDEDLIKAYNDAMAIDIEPENPEVEFVMQGGGSKPPPECPPSPSPRQVI